VGLPGSKNEVIMDPLTLDSLTSLFEIERDAEIVILTPVMDLHELHCREIDDGAVGVLELLADPTTRHVVLDFRQTDYFGSSALGLFVRLWKRVKRRGGRMALCNLSEPEKEILRITHLDQLWPICSSRREALQAVRH
jgi:anti-anti-sigma factor